MARDKLITVRIEGEKRDAFNQLAKSQLLLPGLNNFAWNLARREAGSTAAVIRLAENGLESRDERSTDGAGGPGN